MVLARRLYAGVGIVMGLSILGAALLLPVPAHSHLLEELLNAGHVLVVGGLAILAHRYLSTGGRPARLGPGGAYALAFGAAVILGGLAELAQIPVHRDASWDDVWRDAAGAASFLCLRGSLDPVLKRWGARRRVLFRLLLVGIALVVLTVTLMPAVRWTGAYLRRDATFPTLCTFDSDWERPFWTVRNAHLTLEPPPATWQPAPPGRVGHLVCEPSARAGFAINFTSPDWSTYDHLEVNLFLDEPREVSFMVQLQDREWDGRDVDRKAFANVLLPGVNRIRVPLNQPILLDSGRPLDLHRMQVVYFYCTDRTLGTTLCVDSVALTTDVPAKRDGQ